MNLQRLIEQHFFTSYVQVKKKCMFTWSEEYRDLQYGWKKSYVPKNWVDLGNRQTILRYQFLFNSSLRFAIAVMWCWFFMAVFSLTIFVYDSLRWRLRWLGLCDKGKNYLNKFWKLHSSLLRKKAPQDHLHGAEAQLKTCEIDELKVSIISACHLTDYSKSSSFACLLVLS